MPLNIGRNIRISGIPIDTGIRQIADTACVIREQLFCFPRRKYPGTLRQIGEQDVAPVRDKCAPVRQPDELPVRGTGSIIDKGRASGMIIGAACMPNQPSNPISGRTAKCGTDNGAERAADNRPDNAAYYYSDTDRADAPLLRVCQVVPEFTDQVCYQRTDSRPKDRAERAQENISDDSACNRARSVPDIPLLLGCQGAPPFAYHAVGNPADSNAEHGAKRAEEDTADNPTDDCPGASADADAPLLRRCEVCPPLADNGSCRSKEQRTDYNSNRVSTRENSADDTADRSCRHLHRFRHPIFQV